MKIKNLGAGEPYLVVIPAGLGSSTNPLKKQ
jgi:hypothetical protein